MYLSVLYSPATIQTIDYSFSLSSALSSSVRLINNPVAGWFCTGMYNVLVPYSSERTVQLSVVLWKVRDYHQRTSLNQSYARHTKHLPLSNRSRSTTWYWHDTPITHSTAIQTQHNANSSLRKLPNYPLEFGHWSSTFGLEFFMR